MEGYDWNILYARTLYRLPDHKGRVVTGYTDSIQKGATQGDRLGAEGTASTFGEEAPGNVTAYAVGMTDGVQEVFALRHSNVDGVTRAQGEHTHHSRCNAYGSVTAERYVGPACMLQ